MTDFDQFERRLGAALRSDADQNVAPFEAESIARAAIAGTVRGAMRLPRSSSRLDRRSGRGRGMTLLAAAALLLVGGALAAGSGILQLPTVVPPGPEPSVIAVATASPTAPISGGLAVGGMDQIVLVDPSSKIARALTPSVAHDSYPVWSPDGTRIAFSQHDGRGELQMMDADGSNRHTIVPGITAGLPVTWSPDGERIAFVGGAYPGRIGDALYVVRADGTDLTMLVPDDKGSGISRIAWSPDGSLVAFAAMDDSRPVDGARGYAYVVDVASRIVTQVSSSHIETFGSIAPLAWRPGSMELLYAQQYEQPPTLGRQDIMLAERVGDGWRERPLITGLQPSDATYPEWLDAGRFAYARDGGLWVAGVDGRREVRVGDVPTDPSDPDLVSFPGCVAPDGSALAIPINGGVAFVIVPTDGRPATRINERGTACSWQPLHR